MKNFYDLLIEKSNFDRVSVENAVNFGKNIDISLFSRLFFDTEPYITKKTGVLYFEDSFFPYRFYEQVHKLSLQSQKCALYLYILLAEKAFNLFNERGLCENIFFDTMKSISSDAKEYRISKKNDGLFNYHLLANNLIGNIIRLGEFEYQYGNYNDKCAIFIHVPQSADLSKEKRLESYALAKKYYGDYPIIADSWLLYPENKKMLSPDSRIIDFASDFEIVSISETNDYRELFHIFGRLDDYSYENLPRNTSLQRVYAERVKNNLPVGAAIGILKI